MCKSTASPWCHRSKWVCTSNCAQSAGQPDGQLLGESDEGGQVLSYGPGHGSPAMMPPIDPWFTAKMLGFWDNCSINEWIQAIATEL